MSGRRSSCKRCGRYDTVAGRISSRGLCTDCSTRAVSDNVRTMIDKEGATYEVWLTRTLAGQQRYYSKLNAALEEQWRQRELRNQDRQQK